MLHKQENIFGFRCTSREQFAPEKTATFFSPIDIKEAETSFSTQNTDATRETSSQSTPQQSTKGDSKKKVCTVKRVAPVQINNINRALNRNSLLNLPLISTKASPPTIKTDKENISNSLRNCINQSNIPKTFQNLDNTFKPGTIAKIHSSNDINDDLTHRRNYSDRLVHNASNSTQRVNTTTGYEDIDFEANQIFLGGNIAVRGSSKARSKVTKVNKIKVISSIPTSETVLKTEETASFGSMVSEESGYNKNNNIKIREMLNSNVSNVEDLLTNPKLYPVSSSSKAPGAYLFPDSSTTTTSKIMSPMTPLSTTEDELLFTPTSALNIRRIHSHNTHNTKPYNVTLEPIKGAQEMLTPLKEQAESSLVAKRFNSASNKHSLISTFGEINNYVGPDVKRGFNVFTFKTIEAAQMAAMRQESAATQPQKIQKRVTIKFRNEEAVLNKLFSSGNNKKSE